ncbi:alpha/beta hydrolase [Bacillus wiedmannii]|uniref:IroE protein n=1 Tax=Bacillus wiedmannii TaxID=1890302 RepID=A0A2B5JCV7_9BACI|nr:alpha/beta hydrolase-fold protein [Bacillus wiedmannii]MCU5706840.1 alpha/beta hydrolase-fold protein [Bacillus wiedmannii]PEJ71248.1 IroE protein [Bacillus wiedmannii]PEM48220.1 IroE protein [Bacillus wiedmannii]PFZ35041.1 IroE protein [Bacillus wiedmannii]PHC88157.1 IroE protein [Bacillus wiedmannii]
MNTTIEKQQIITSNTEQWKMYSKIEGKEYQIHISKPRQPAPESGYSVIYVLDGNAFFQTFHEAVKIQSVRAEKTGVSPAIIVGIGYPIEGAFSGEERCYDFTPSVISKDAPLKPDGKPWPKTGGAHNFFTFIEEELKPQIENDFEIDKGKQTLFGHSLGGLFALHILFTNVNAFQNYFISSPSIWWNNQSVLEKEVNLISELNSAKFETGVFLTVGSLEREHMVVDANELSKRLLQVKHDQFRFTFYEAEGENHASVVPTSLSKGLRFISYV